MAAPIVTRAALTQIRRLVTQAHANRPVVHIIWEAQKVDNTRGPNGETVWKRLSEGRWIIFVLDFAAPDLRKCADTPTVKAHGIEWADLFCDRYKRTIQ